MSRWASKADLHDEIRRTITTNHNRTGLPTDTAAFNMAGVYRDMGIFGGGTYGWTYDFDVDFVQILHDNLRPGYRKE